MRLATLLPALAVLTACMSEPDASGPSACGAAGFQGLVGLPAAGHGFPPGTRIIPPGAAVTMDHRPDRLNVETDEDGVITRVYCG